MKDPFKLRLFFFSSTNTNPVGLGLTKFTSKIKIFPTISSSQCDKICYYRVKRPIFVEQLCSPSSAKANNCNKSKEPESYKNYLQKEFSAPLSNHLNWNQIQINK